MSNLDQIYQKDIKDKLAKEFKLVNIMTVPKLIKININCGLSEALGNKKTMESMLSQIVAISGQKPMVTHAKHDISSFKLRKGDAIGIKVTLRGKRMYDFFEKLVKIVLPRIRDFRGVSDNGFDNSGNYSLGLREQIVFPEIEYSQIDKIRGFQMTFVISGNNKAASKKLLELLGMPFVKKRA